MTMTGEGMELRTGLWLDEPGYRERIAHRLESGQIDEDEAAGLERFAQEGYLVVDLDVPATKLEALLAGVDRLWRERPLDLAYAYDSPPRRLSGADQAQHRRPRYRIHDLHSHLAEALELYLHPELHRWARRILGDEVVAIQSLFFEYGSQQVLHRDTVVVPTGAPGRLLAVWIALEEIHPESGALDYVPGSHRLPYYEFRPGQYEFDASTMGEAEIRAATAFDDEQARRHGLEPRLFTARRGQALFWHASLRHGGGPVSEPPRTRKSFVVHYSELATYRTRSITLEEPGEGGPSYVVTETQRLLERDGCRGFDNPLRGAARG
jgi:phytanoyl-CoA hydroxylase